MEGRKIEEPCYRAKEEENEKKVVHHSHSESESEVFHSIHLMQKVYFLSSS